MYQARLQKAFIKTKNALLAQLNFISVSALRNSIKLLFSLLKKMNVIFVFHNKFADVTKTLYQMNEGHC